MSKKREHKELKLKLVAVLKPNEIKRKWEIIKSVTDSTFEDDPAEGIHIDRYKTYFEKLGTDGEEDDCLPTDFIINQNMISIEGNKIRTMKSDLNKLFTKVEVMQSKDTLKNGKSTGINGVRNEIIKQCLITSSFVDISVTLFNQIFEMGSYQGSKNKGSNYRGISLSSCLAKFFNNLILKRLNTCFENLNLFHPHLMGFSPRMRTSNNCLALKTLVDKQFKENERLCSCFIDFSKALSGRKDCLQQLNHMV